MARTLILSPQVRQKNLSYDIKMSSQRDSMDSVIDGLGEDPKQTLLTHEQNASEPDLSNLRRRRIAWKFHCLVFTSYTLFFLGAFWLTRNSSCRISGQNGLLYCT
jgi:hypothetical protein